MKHDELADLLAAWLRSACDRMTWNNFRFDTYGTGRPDVFSMAKTLHLKKSAPMVHEVKISRADFWADVRADKWRKYQPFCSQFFFVCPAGMVNKDEVPKDAGLIFYTPDTEYKYNSFKLVKRPKPNKNWVIDETLTMRLILGRWGSEPGAFALMLRAITK